MVIPAYKLNCYRGVFGTAFSAIRFYLCANGQYLMSAEQTEEPHEC